MIMQISFEELAPEEREMLLVNSLRYCANLVKSEQSSKEKLDKLSRDKARLREDIEEMEEQIAGIGPAAKRETCKKLVEVRDRVAMIAETVEAAGKRMYSSARGKKITVVELNNIIDSLAIIVDTMKNAGMWPDNEEPPKLESIVPYQKPEKKAKKDESQLEVAEQMRLE